MKTETLNPSSKLLAWESSLNSRELGGYPTASGGHIRWKTLVRSETTSLLNLTGQQALLDYGIRTVIDLRFPSELEARPSPFAGRGNETWPDYLQIPLDQDQGLSWSGEGDPVRAMNDLYCRLLEVNRGHVAAVISAIANARPGGVLYHCHAGKDRTGLITALILGAAGVPREIIIQDYAYAHPLFLERRHRELLSPDLTPHRREILTVLTNYYPDAMALTLDYLDQRYGGAEGYLATTPLGRKDLDTLLERIVERPE